MSFTQAPPKWGMSDRELAEYPLVYREDLFAGKTVLISGGGSGMGKAMTFLFARLGAQVVICARNEERLASTQSAVEEHLGRQIDYVPMTIRDPEAVQGLMERIWSDHGGADFLVNNAGGQFPQPALDYSVKGWNAVIDTNLNGTWYMMQAMARRWRDDGTAGSIVNIVANVTRGMPQVAHTCAARAGVIYLTKSVSTEWAPLGIRVNCVSPGAIDTEGLNVYEPKAALRFKDSNPLRTFGDAYDIAQAVAYLCAPCGKFITGEVVTVDGGNNQWGDTWPGGVPEEFKVDFG
ncbi:MAG: SDR family oxidoreductase [Xanthomonadales bacterium]|nr:SDR family oxidoreductase [Xanthomonadales bacterium]